MRQKIRKKESKGEKQVSSLIKANREIPVGRRLQEVTIDKARKVLKSL